MKLVGAVLEIYTGTDYLFSSVRGRTFELFIMPTAPYRFRSSRQLNWLFDLVSAETEQENGDRIGDISFACLVVVVWTTTTGGVFIR